MCRRPGARGPMTRSQTLGIAVLIVAGGLQAAGQSPSNSTFEVASIKPSRSDTSGSSRLGLGVQPGGRYTTTNVTARELIRVAYGRPDPLDASRVIGGPGWLDSDRFDLLAKAPDGSGIQQLFPMLQSLLADRFKLTIRAETRELPIYALVGVATGKLGPSLQPAEDCTARPRDATVAASPRMLCGIDGSRPGRLVFGGMPISALASHPALPRELRRVVVDRTGLNGFYSGTLEWTPSALAGRSPFPPTDASPPPADGPSIFAAVQEQLGLKLEFIRGPVDVLVIESVERPTPD